MPFLRPTLTELQARVESDLEAELGLGPLPRRSALRALALVEAAQAHLLHGHVQYATQQVLATTATGEWLDRHADLYGIVRKAAVKATGTVRFEGAVDGTVVPAGAQLQSAGGVLYVNTASATVGVPTTVVEVQVEAVEGGAGGNLASGSPVNLSAPIAGIPSTGTVAITDAIDGGADAETDAALLDRLKARLSDPPQGGALADYRLWALEVPEVTRAWPFANPNGPGTVSLTFVTDDALGGPIPTSGKVAEVLAYLEERRPVTVNELQVFAPVEVPLDITVGVNPNTTDVQQSVLANLEDLLLREAEPGRTLPLSTIAEAVATATGEVYHLIETPVGNVTTEANELLTLGTVTFNGLPNL